MKNLKDGLTSVDVTYYAHWTALPTCTIAFDPAGGELEMTSLQVLQVGVVGELPTPRYTGYHFVGWFTAGGAPFTAECSMSADITLHARWERLPLVSGGGADWFVRADGVWQSGAVGNSTSSWAEVTVTAPCVVSFDWKTSSEAGYDKLSFFVDGALAAEPISGTTSDWTNVSYTAIGTVGTRTLRWVYAKDYSQSEGDISNDQTTWMETTVAGPCEISFDWKVESETWDRLHFYVDGVEVVAAISGYMTTWSLISYVVGDMSEHTIRWAYTKDYSVSSYSDCGWIKDFLVSGLSFDGAGFLVAGGRLLAYNGEGGDIEIPAGVTSIDEDVFSENETITSVVFPDTLKSIGDGVFYGCSGIEDVTIPASVTDLGYHAFGYCTSLRAVRFLGNKPAIVTSKYGSGCYEGTPDSLTSFVRRDRLESWASDASDALPLSWGKRAIAFWDYTPVTRAVPVAVGHAWLAERWEALRTKYASLAPAIWRDMSEVPEDDRKKYRFFKGVMEMR